MLSLYYYLPFSDFLKRLNDNFEQSHTLHPFNFPTKEYATSTGYYYAREQGRWLLVPRLLSVEAQNFARENGGVLLHIRRCVSLCGLNTVQDLQELVLDEVNEDEVDRCVIRDAGRI